MRIILKNQPKMQLVDLLKRRKMTLLQFVTEHAITTYMGLCERCKMMGVAAPDETSYRIAVPEKEPVNSPQEGVIVVDPPVVVDELTGRTIDPDAPIEPGVTVVVDVHEHVNELETTVVTSVNQSKRSRKKKDILPNG